METENQQLVRLEEKIDAVYASVEKSRKYILVMLIVTLVMIILPFIFALVVLPSALNSIGNVYGV